MSSANSLRAAWTVTPGFRRPMTAIVLPHGRIVSSTAGTK